MSALPAVSSGIDPARSLEENYFALARLRGRSPLVEFTDDGEVSHTVSRVAATWANQVCDARIPLASVEVKIASVVAFFAARGFPFSWLVGPGSNPADLRQHLEAAGFERQPDTPCMVIDLKDLQEPTLPAQATVRRAADQETLLHARVPISLAFSMPDAVALFNLRIASDVGFAPETPWRHYIAYWGGQPVAASSLFLAAGVAGLYGVATHPDWRGRGFGRAVTLIPLLEARREGFHLGVLRSTQPAEPMYRRLGFKQVGRFTDYVWRNV